MRGLLLSNGSSLRQLAMSNWALKSLSEDISQFHDNFFNSVSYVTGEKVLLRGVHKAETYTVIFLLHQKLWHGC